MFTTFYMNPQNLGTFRLGFHSGLPWAYDEEYHFGQGLDRFTGSIQLQHHPVKWFTHRLTFGVDRTRDRKSTRLNSSHGYISYAVFCLKKKKLIVMHLNYIVRDQSTKNNPAISHY